MNFVIFPMFFLPSALYPLWKMQESNDLLYRICSYNPFTHAVELIRFTLYLQWNGAALAWTAGWLALFLTVAIVTYDPKHCMIRKRGGA